MSYLIPGVILVCIPVALVIWAITALLIEIRAWTDRCRDEAWREIREELNGIRIARRELENAAYKVASPR